MAAKVRKGDRVVVTTGRDKGKKGEVLRVYPSDERVLISGVNLIKKHQKQSQTQAGGIITKEAPLHVSNVAHIDPKSGEPTRVGFRMIDAGNGEQKKVRFAKKSGELIDV